MKHRIATLSLLVASIYACGAAFAPAYAQKAGEPITLNFANAEIEAVARTIATITNRNVVVDPRVKGTINLQTERPVTPTAAYNQFLATIRLQGFTVVEAGGLYKVVPEADAKVQSGVVSAGPAVPGGNQIVTQIFKLNYETANNLVPVLRPLISPNNTISVNPGNNSLIITDYADNLQRMSKIIAALDVSNATDLEVVPLRNAVAGDLIPILNRLIETSSGAATGAAAQGQADTSFKTALLAEPRSNAIIIRASNPARVALIRSLIARLDQPAMESANGAAGNIYVVYLKNADAVKLATTLRAAMGAGSSGSSSSGSGSTPSSSTSSGLAPTSSTSSGLSVSSMSAATAGSGSTIGGSSSSNQPSTGGQIQADPATNSLIITAPEPQYRQIRAVIDKLDSRRAQVMVESLIVEVNANKAAELSVQWQGVLGKSGDANIGVLGSNFNIGGTNIITAATSAAAGTVAASPGFNVGVGNRVNGVYVLGFLARFFESSGDANVLSTPTLLTMDNEEAKIVVGQNVPFVTGQYTSNNTATGSVNPFQTVERKDVGITLRVKPTISENGTVKLGIFQEVSAIDNTTTSTAGLITTKRSIESNVLVDDGQIIVIGGLLSDTYSNNVQKIPGLGDLPVVGNLFKSQARSRNKNNLMVFLRPVVVRDAMAADTMSIDRYDVIRALQQNSQPGENPLLDAVKTSPVLPRLPQSPKLPLMPGAEVPPAAQPSSPSPK